MCNFHFDRCAYCLNRLYFNVVEKDINGRRRKFHRRCLLDYEQVEEMAQLARIQSILMKPFNYDDLEIVEKNLIHQNILRQI